MKYIICVLMLAIVTGCFQNQSEPSHSTTALPVIDQNERSLFPAKVERPVQLRWKTAPNGLEIASWLIADYPVVFCTIRNLTKKPVVFPGDLGWWEFTRVFARGKDSGNWIEIKLRPSGFRCVMGSRSKPVEIGPGKEVRMVRTHHDSDRYTAIRQFSFYVDLAEYSFPNDISGEVEIRIESLGYEFPIATVPLKIIPVRKIIDQRVDHQRCW